MAAGLLFSVFTSLVLSYHRILWEDEMLGWMLLHDPSWRHMISAWKQGADGGGFTFYLTGRLWFALFGASDVAFRLYSTIAFGISFCLLWVMLRRFYTVPVTAFALINTWFFNPVIVSHMAEGRFYGLLMLGVILATFLFLKADRTPGSPLSLCALFFLVHAVLTTSHSLGVIYSATVLLALFTLDLASRRRPRPLLYLSGALAWLLLIPEHAAMAASARVGKPHFWTTPPTLSRFVGAYTSFSAEIALVLFLLAIALVLSLRKPPVLWKPVLRSAWHTRRPAWILTAAFLLIPVALTLACLVGPSLFTNRYLMPVALAQALLTAEAITLIRWSTVLPASLLAPRLRRRAIAAFTCLLLLWIFVHIRRHSIPQHTDYTVELTTRFPKGIPVVCEDAWAFTEIIGRQHSSGVPYIYLLDWPQSILPSAPRLEVTEFHLMDTWRSVGFFSGSIQPIDDFLRRTPRFFLLHRDPPIAMVEPNRIGNPLFERFSHSPAYQVQPFGPRDKDGYQKTWLVCRGRCNAPPPRTAPIPPPR
jgi:hypothetical protein